MLCASHPCQNPRAIAERWLVPHVLSMPTSQIGNPVALFILMIADDGLIHTPPRHSPSTICHKLPFLKRQLRPLCSRNIRPAFVLILVETSDKYDVSIEIAKFREASLASL